MQSKAILALGVVGICLVGWLGYDYGSTKVQQRWDEARAATEQETAVALAALATRFQDAEQRYAAERDRKRRVVTRTVTEVKREIQTIPVRDCDLLPVTHSLLVKAHCAAFGASDPECVHGEMPRPSDAATGEQQ